MKKANHQKVRGYKIGYKLGHSVGYNQGRLDLEEEINNVFSFYFKNENRELQKDCIANLINYDFAMKTKLRDKDFELNQYKQALKDLLKIISRKEEITEALLRLNLNTEELLEEEKTDAERKK